MTARNFRPDVRVPPSVMRLGVRYLGGRCLDPALPWDVQRRRLDRLARGSVLPRGTAVARQVVGGVPAYVVSARASRAQSADSEGGPAWGRDHTGYDQCRPAPMLVIHFHGGGYCVGSARTTRTWAAHLSAQTGCRVVLPEYRLAPEHRHPAALEDARAVLRALRREDKTSTLVVSGDSAGGGLALALTLSLRDDGGELPAGCVLLSPWLDLGSDRRADADLVRRDVLLSADWLDACARAYADPGDWASAMVSPLCASHAGLPPLLIQAGTDDLVAPDAAMLAASASAAGADVTYTTWPGMWHDFMLEPGLLAAADSAVRQAAKFVGRVAADC